MVIEYYATTILMYKPTKKQKKKQNKTNLMRRFIYIFLF